MSENRKNGKGFQQTKAEDPNPPVFFYMPTEKPYGLFCQWSSTHFKVPLSTLSWLETSHPKSSEGVTPRQMDLEEFEFNCSEQFMMYYKARYFHDAQSGQSILASKDPAVQKAMGRKFKGWDEYLWREVCERVAFEGNWWKFNRNKAWRHVLLGTGERVICEAARQDRRWGIGYNADEAMEYRDQWGENLLGKALMKAREQIRRRLNELEAGRTDWDLPEEMDAPLE